jgi:hypothetical protein
MSTCKGDVKVEHVKEAAAEMCKVLENSDFFPTNPRNNGNKVVDGIDYNFFVEWDTDCIKETAHRFDTVIRIAKICLKLQYSNVS